MAPSDTLSLPATIVLTLGALDFGLEQSIVVPALPEFARTYDASLIAVAWLSTAFLLSSVVAVPLLGRLADLHGKRRLLLVALGAFTLGSLLCALTHSIAYAIAGRAVQGFGAAVAPLTLGLARDIVPREQLARTIGIVVAAANLGGGIGFLTSGLLVDAFSASAIFWFLFGFGVLLLSGVLLAVRESPARAESRLDLLGSFLLAVGLATLLLAISKGTAWGWSSRSIVSLFVLAALGLVAFAFVERRVREPLVDLRLVVTRPFANANACAVLFGFSFFVATFVLPQIAASPKGLAYTTTHVGLLLVPGSVAGMSSSWLGGRIVERVGSRALVATGAALGVTGYLMLAAAHTTAVALAAGTTVIGIGLGFVLTGIYPVVLHAARSDESGVAVAIVVVLRNTAVSVGVTVAFVIITAANVLDTGYTRAFLLGAGGAALACASAFFLPSRRTIG